MRRDDPPPQQPAGSERPGRLRASCAYGLSAGLILLPACTNVITPPPQPLQPQSVFVLDHGRHASLVLPRPDGGLVRYAYGDWKYYALRETGVLATSGAAFFPTQAGLARRGLRGPATAAGVRRAVGLGIEALYEVVVGRPALEGLRERLDSIFYANLETWLYNPAYDLDFVHHPRAYTIVSNSNRIVALWLRELGCRVSGLLLFSRWKVGDAGIR